MAKKITTTYSSKTKTRRRNKLRPFNGRKKLGPKSAWRGTKKRKRGQGG